VNDHLRDVEKEIDQAIDQMFFGESQEVPPEEPEVAASESAFREPVPPKEGEKAGRGIALSEEKKEEGKESARSYLDVVESLERKVRAMSEWGVTEAAVDKIIVGMEKIHEAFGPDEHIRKVVEMVAEILSRIKENPASQQDGDLVNFLLDAFGFIKSRIETESGQRGEKGEKIYDEIHDRYLSLSAKMTSGEEQPVKRPPAPQEAETEEVPSWLEQTTLWGSMPQASSERAFPEAASEKPTAGGEDIINLGLESLASGPPEVAQIEEEESVEGEEKPSLFSKSLSSPGYAEPTEKTEKDGDKKAEALPRKVSIENLHALTEMLSETLRAVKRSLWESKGLKDLTEMLAIEMAEMNRLCKRVAEKTTDPAVRNDTEELARSLNKIQKDFIQLTDLLDPVSSQEMGMEAVIPVAVGRKVVALREVFVEAIYSISREQEKRFREKGVVLLKGKRLPFIDLGEEYHEVSNRTDRRLVIFGDEKAQKALLVDKVLKRRIALLARRSSLDSPRNAGIYIKEEMPVFE